MAYNDIVEQQDRDILNANQQIRQSIIARLTENGSVPSSKDDRIFLLETMKDMDKSVISKAKIKVSDKSNDNMANINSIIAKLLINHTNTQQTLRTTQPLLDSNIKVDNLVEGETDIGLDSLNYDDLVR